MKLVILDRDGVINYESDEFIKSPDEWIAIPKSLEAIATFTKMGFTISVASNQSGIGRGLFSEATLSHIHRKMLFEVELAQGKIDSIFYCPHTPEENCLCRKPKPGLLHQIQLHYGKDSLKGIPFIGDSARDLDAARAIGCRPILVKTGRGKNALARGVDTAEVEVYEDLLQAAAVLCRERANF